MCRWKIQKLHFSILYHVHKLSWEIISKREKNIKGKTLPTVFLYLCCFFFYIKLNSLEFFLFTPKADLFSLSLYV